MRPKTRWCHEALSMNNLNNPVNPQSQATILLLKSNWGTVRTEEQRTLAACRLWNITRNPHGLVLTFLLFHRHCPSSSLLIFDLPPSSLLLLTLLIHILHFRQSPTAKSILTSISKCHLFSHILSLTLISAFSALQKVHPPFFLWYCTVNTDPECSSPLISALLSIYSTHTAEDFPAAGFLSSAPAGKRSSICEESKGHPSDLVSDLWLCAGWICQ